MTLADRLQACHTSVVHDVMKDMGLPIRVLPRTITGLEPSMKAAGPVFTIRGAPIRPWTNTLRCTNGQGCCPRSHRGAWWFVSPKTTRGPCSAAYRPRPWPSSRSVVTLSMGVAGMFRPSSIKNSLFFPDLPHPSTLSALGARKLSNHPSPWEVIRSCPTTMCWRIVTA